MCIGELSSVLYRQYQIYINRYIKPYGINSSELMFLIKVDIEAINQKQLSDSLCVDYAIATRSLKTLEKKGLIVRAKSEMDARSIIVSLTKKGEKIKKIGLQARQEWKKIVMESVIDNQADYLLKIFKEMAKKAIYETNLSKEELYE